MSFQKWSEKKLALDEAVSMGEMVSHIGDCYDEIDRARQACAGLRGLADRASQYQSERDQARAQLAALSSPPSSGESALVEALEKVFEWVDSPQSNRNYMAGHLKYARDILAAYRTAKASNEGEINDKG